MPDITTAPERDMIAAFLASRPVTICPPRYSEHVHGGADYSSIKAPEARELTYRERKSREAENVKRRRRIEGASKAKRDEENRTRNEQGLALERQRKMEAAAERIGRVLRFLGAEWTWDRLAEAANKFKHKTTKNICAYLRYHGHGDKLPTRVKAEKPVKVRAAREMKPKKASTPREPKVKLIKVAAPRVRKVAKASVDSRRCRATDHEISTFVAAGNTCRQARAHFHCGQARVRDALKATGTEGKKTRPPQMARRKYDHAEILRFHAAGIRPCDIAREVGAPLKSVDKIIARNARREVMP